MQGPVTIAFHNIESSAEVEEEIRSKIAKLEKLYGRLSACRVRVDQRAKRAGGATPPVVRIELGIPGGKDLVVSHEPDHLRRKYQTPDLSNAINEAFRIAQDQLIELKKMREGRTKEIHHDSENQLLGTIADVNTEQDFGFVTTNDGRPLYFHRNSILSGTFDALKAGEEVYYVEEMGDTGPIASKVRVK